MVNRIEIFTTVNDTKSLLFSKKLQQISNKFTQAKAVEVYTVAKNLNSSELEKIAKTFSNPVSKKYFINQINPNLKFDFALEIGFLPGVTDNVASTAKETISELLNLNFTKSEGVYTSTLYLIEGNNLHKSDIEKASQEFANSLIERIHIKSFDQFTEDQGMDKIVPIVKLSPPPKPLEVDLNLTDEDLIELGQKGIQDQDGSRRGPLALDKNYMLAIKEYFLETEKRNPTDIELESIAQTWSEHCKHTIFASEIDEIKDGIYKHYIKRATNEIRADKGEKDFCVSVFSDNSGAIIFDENYLVTDKAETHNSPSALDPFGGSITGIVGVNRDTLGFGKGAKPIVNKYGFCVGNPDDRRKIFRDKELSTPMLSPKRILEGVVAGVNAGGNESGIPTPQGFVRFDERFKGKPLVFVGTVGLIPKKINQKNSWEKNAKDGDKIVVIGGRVGQDGIHGATFSSEALTTGSPATAVQIGDPITQKKLSDAIIKEVREKDLYNSITDNGAGGISCSIAEMAKECGGCEVELEKVPLKYPNLEPWKIWISESQERMTLAIPEKNLEKFEKIMKKHGVESTVIGTFNNSGRCKVNYEGETIMDLDMNFLHDGLPPKILKTTYTKPQNPEPTFKEEKNLNSDFLVMLERPNCSSFSFISRQYDHNVQGTSVLKPLQGKGEVNGNTSVSKPLLNSKKGVVCSQGINPSYSDIDTYHMAASAIDSAIRNVIAAGGNLDHLAIMDNFCWCSSTEEERLGQLKDAAKACYDYAKAFGTPYISGKDSMFNDFKGFNIKGEPIKISIPPTLLVSSLSVMEDVTKTVSLDPKFAGDLIYVIGKTKNELGASEYFYQKDKEKIGMNVPKVDAKTASSIYRKYMKAVDQRLISSSLSPNIGGLAVTLAKKAIAGQLGMKINLQNLDTENLERNDFILFSETQSRFVVTIDPNKKEEFEEMFRDCSLSLIGEITAEKDFIVEGLNGNKILNLKVTNLEKSYKKTFANF